MWHVLKAVTILFTICPGLQRKKLLSLFYFLKKKLKKYIFLLVIFTRRKNFNLFSPYDFYKEIFVLTFQLKDVSLAVKNHRKLFMS